MAGYKDKKNYVPHDFNNFLVTLSGSHNVEGLESIAAEYLNDQWTPQNVADGTGIMVKNSSRAGELTLEILAASPSSDFLWDAHAASMDSNTLFSASVKNSAAAKFNIKETYFAAKKPPTVEGKGEAAMETWILTAVYMEIRGGSYALQAA